MAGLTSYPRTESSGYRSLPALIPSRLMQVHTHACAGAQKHYEDDPFSAKLYFPMEVWFKDYPEPMVLAAFRRRQQAAWVDSLNHAIEIATKR